MVSLPYWLLITPAMIAEAALKSFGRKQFAQASDDLYPAAAVVCRSVTATIHEALNCKLIVHPYAQHFLEEDWCNDPRFYRRTDEYISRVADARAWPIVQGIDVDGSALQIANVLSIAPANDRFLVSDQYFEERPEVISYFAGYRRADQTVAGADTSGAVLDCGSGSGDTACLDLSEEAGLEGLTELPPLLPEDITRVALRLAIFELRVELRGLPGFDRTIKTIEGVSIEVERPDRDFEERELRKIKPVHRRPPSMRG